ncbi:sigma W regulon antibacterial [Candidatus Brocadia pituitae]|nr:sigma W regulon antibacterial [Candidatus Brocadia pituitae]
MQYMPLLTLCISMSIFLYLLLFFFVSVCVGIFYKYGGLYIKATTSDARVSLAQMISMTFRNIDVRSVVDHRIMAKKAGIDIAASFLEAHHLAGGRVNNVIHALIAARKANIQLSFDHACAIDLAGRDVFDAVKTGINPKVVECPDPSKGCATLDAVTKDGIQIKLKVRITLRTNIERIVGGATEETIIARVSEGILATISTFETYKKAFENPDLLSRLVMEKNYDSDTAFQILSVNIVDITIGENIDANLQTGQAEADKRIAQADAVKRRGMALAREQEMKVLTEENIAKILAAEAEVPKAIAQAFREGNLGVMDYYHLKNIQADTEMRASSVSKLGIPPPATKP